MSYAWPDDVLPCPFKKETLCNAAPECAISPEGPPAECKQAEDDDRRAFHPGLPEPGESAEQEMLTKCSCRKNVRCAVAPECAMTGRAYGPLPCEEATP